MCQSYVSRDAAINQLEQLRVVAEDAGEITTAADACLNLAVLSYKEDEVKLRFLPLEGAVVSSVSLVR